MISRAEQLIEHIIECLAERPHDDKMSLWLKRVACIATIWAIVYSARMGLDNYVMLFTISLTAWFIDSEISAHKTYLYVDVVCIGIVTGVVLTVVLSGGLGQIACFVALMIAVLSVFILGLLWGNVLGLFSCLFMAVVFSININNKMVDMYSKEFCERFVYIMTGFMATANFIVYGMTNYWINKRKYTENLSELIEKGKAGRRDVNLKILVAMYKTLETKSPQMAKHSELTAIWTRLIAGKMGVRKEEELKTYYYAGLLHDIGKIGIPDVYMDRTELTDEEYEVYKKHVDIGYDIINQLELEKISDAALYHHEKWKGDGYKGLRADEIPEIARIVGIANFISRLEQKDVELEQIKKELTAQGGKAYDIRIVKLACEAIDDQIRLEKERSILGQSVF